MTDPGPEVLEWFAVAAPGLEGVLADELRALPGSAEASANVGGVTFHGPLTSGYAANLCSAVATRVLVRVGEARARQRDALERRLARLPFERFLAPGQTLRVQASAHHCRLHHTVALAEVLQGAASKRIGGPLTLQRHADDDAQDAQSAPGREPFVRALVRGEQDVFVASIDSSGALLHRRGARVETGRAPLRETLAAGLLRLAGYDVERPLVNAMCGAGTLAIEAADMALVRAPGRARGFAFESFPCFSADTFARLRAQVASRERSALRAPIYAFDRDPRAREFAARNFERAALGAHIELACADVLEYPPPARSGLLIANPPYGRRLGGHQEVRALYRALGQRLRTHWRGWRIALLVPRAVPPAAFGLRQAQATPLLNGGLPVKLLVADLA
jgi:putative N6-adenine-specific DNA methylase